MMPQYLLRSTLFAGKRFLSSFTVLLLSFRLKMSAQSSWNDKVKYTAMIRTLITFTTYIIIQTQDKERLSYQQLMSWIKSVQNALNDDGNDMNKVLANCDWIKSLWMHDVNQSSLGDGKMPIIRACPKCNSLIQCNQACKHIICLACHHQFCFNCLGTWRDQCSHSNACNLYKNSYGGCHQVITTDMLSTTRMDKLLNVKYGKDEFESVTFTLDVFAQKGVIISLKEVKKSWKIHEIKLRLLEELLSKKLIATNNYRWRGKAQENTELYYKGRRMEVYKTLEYYDIVNDDHVPLIVVYKMM